MLESYYALVMKDMHCGISNELNKQMVTTGRNGPAFRMLTRERDRQTEHPLKSQQCFILSLFLPNFYCFIVSSCNFNNSIY